VCLLHPILEAAVHNKIYGVGFAWPKAGHEPRRDRRVVPNVPVRENDESIHADGERDVGPADRGAVEGLVEVQVGLGGVVVLAHKSRFAHFTCLVVHILLKPEVHPLELRGLFGPVAKG
jgi:hypothetical protein